MVDGVAAVRGVTILGGRRRVVQISCYVGGGDLFPLPVFCVVLVISCFLAVTRKGLVCRRFVLAVTVIYASSVLLRGVGRCCCVVRFVWVFCFLFRVSFVERGLCLSCAGFCYYSFFLVV